MKRFLRILTRILVYPVYLAYGLFAIFYIAMLLAAAFFFYIFENETSYQYVLSEMYSMYIEIIYEPHRNFFK